MTISIVVFGGVVAIVVGGVFAIREYVLTKKVSTEPEQQLFL